MWGFGGLTFGLTMRYLGLSLGMAVALGLTTVIGTLGPPIFHGTMGEIAAKTSGQLTLLGIVITLVGIVVVARGGAAKSREVPSGEAVAEFDLKKGLAIATFSGVMSGCFAWGLDAGQPIRDLTLAAGTDPLSQGLPVLCVVLLGLTTNALWCAYLIVKNRSLGQFFGASNDVAQPRALGGQLAAGRAGRHAVVWPVLLLHDGREPDGPIWLFQLDPAYGQHHPVLDALGLCAERMAGHLGAHPDIGVERDRPVDRGDRGDRWRQYVGGGMIV
jgi:L-rhamnose-H+ transport protein